MIRTAGIDYGLSRVVLCSLPVEGEGYTGMRFHEQVLPMRPDDDLADRLRELSKATRAAYRSNAGLDVVSTCIEESGVGKFAASLKMYASFGAVAAGVPNSSEVCCMNAAEWKRRLGLPTNKQVAHTKLRERDLNGLLEMLDEHHLDALCIAYAWRQVQQDEVLA